MAPTKMLAGLLLLLAVGLAQAEVVIVEGQTPRTGNQAADRDRALNEAAKKALQGEGVPLQATDVFVRDGVLDNDAVAKQSRGKINAIRLLQHWEEEGVLHTRVEVDFNAQAQCERESLFAKKVFVTAMRRETPQSSAVGALGNVDKEFSRELAQRLHDTFNTRITDNSHQILPADSQTVTQPELVPAVVLEVAKNQNSQFVLTGSILDMAMAHPEKYRTSLAITRSGERIKRHLAFRVLLYDGMTGVLIFDKTYTGTGAWATDPANKVGFATPEFWALDYGKTTRHMLDAAALDLGASLKCQPFMVNAEYLASEQKVYLPAGLNQGFKVGDVLALYHRKNLPRHADFSLADVGVSLTITQTYADYSLASASKELFENYPYIAVSW